MKKSKVNEREKLQNRATGEDFQMNICKEVGLMWILKNEEYQTCTL